MTGEPRVGDRTHRLSTGPSTAAAAASSDAGLGLYLLRFALHPSEVDEHLLECSLTD